MQKNCIIFVSPAACAHHSPLQQRAPKRARAAQRPFLMSVAANLLTAASTPRLRRGCVCAAVAAPVPVTQQFANGCVITWVRKAEMPHSAGAPAATHDQALALPPAPGLPPALEELTTPSPSFSAPTQGVLLPLPQPLTAPLQPLAAAAAAAGLALALALRRLDARPAAVAGVGPQQAGVEPAVNESTPVDAPPLVSRQAFNQYVTMVEDSTALPDDELARLVADLQASTEVPSSRTRAPTTD